MKELKKVVLVPDSFKGSMTSGEVCAAMAAGVRAVFPAAEIAALPVADGGEGSVEAFLTALGGERVTVTVTGPLGTPVEGFYGLLPDKTAVIEMAAAAGLPLVGGQMDPERTTTYGVGELLLHAAEHGAKRVVLCLGGSATNDGGCGMAAACGIQFLDGSGAAFVPVGGTLGSIEKVAISEKYEVLKNLPIVTMCDIENPLCGPLGAAAVFAPQKGADAAMVERLEREIGRASCRERV